MEKKQKKAGWLTIKWMLNNRNKNCGCTLQLDLILFYFTFHSRQSVINVGGIIYLSLQHSVKMQWHKQDSLYFPVCLERIYKRLLSLEKKEVFKCVQDLRAAVDIVTHKGEKCNGAAVF